MYYDLIHTEIYLPLHRDCNERIMPTFTHQILMLTKFYYAVQEN